MRAVRLSRVVAVLAAGSLALVSGAAAQSLAEIAARQKEKRKGKAVKVYTEDDLKSGPTRGFTPGEPAAPAPAEDAAAAAPAAAVPAGEGQAPPQKSEDELRAEQQKAWREKLQRTRDNVTQLSAEANRLQTALNDLTQPVYGATRAARVTALEKTKQQLAAAQQAVEELEEEGRRNGFR